MRLGLQRCLSEVTLEPLVFLHGIADFMGRFSDDQMLLYKICRGRKIKELFVRFLIIIVSISTINHKHTNLSLKTLQTFKTFLTNIQIFLEEKFNLTREFCSHIESYSNTTEYTAVEQEVKI